jgi:hypothetical protein
VDAGASALGTVTITNLAPGHFEIGAGASTRLATHATLEQRGADGTWKALENLDLGKGYRLLERCAEEAPSCVEVAPDRPLRPVAFRGFDCSAQCNQSCRANVWLGPGAFRLAVHGCGEPASSGDPRGPTFELPDARSPQAFARWGIATDVVRATIMRADLPVAGGWDVVAPPTSARVAGLVARASSERPLDHAGLDTLLALLRDPKGYDDAVAKRCAVENIVGVRLYRRLATTALNDETELDTVELAFDFRCQKFFAVTGGSKGRPREVVVATHFDPSRAAWSAFVKRELAEDPEIRKLK